MSDRPLDPLEEEALRRVRANLLGAIREHERAPHGSRRRLAVLSIGAAGALAAGVGIYVAVDHERDASVDTVHGEPQPTVPPPRVTIASRAPRPPATTPTTTTAPPGPRPSDFVAVTNDGRLVVVDAVTGVELRELTRGADPQRASEPEVGQGVISGVTVDRTHGIVYFETCCEPAAGVVYAVPLAGGEVTRTTELTWAAVTADGDTLVGVAADVVIAWDQASGNARIAREREVTISHTAVAHDGSALAYERASGDGGDLRSEVVVVASDALLGDLATEAQQRAALDGAKVWQDPEGVGWMFPVFNREGDIVVAQQCCYGREAGEGTRSARVVDPDTGAVVGSFQYPAAVVDQEYDATGTWLVVTLADRRVVWFGGGGSGELGGGYLAADW